MKKSLTLLLLFCLIVSTIQAQERYIEEVFTDDQITVTSDVHFATNATLFPLLFLGAEEFLPEALMMDVYEPDQSIDTEEDRPMVMVVHGGDALPRLVNNACWGDKTDSVTVATAKKLARMGYVAIAPNYRLGWNPLATEQDAFLDGLFDAGIRIKQDLHACARYLRKDIAEDGNTYHIAADKFGLWGTASSAGTYSGLTAYINTIEEVQTPTYFVEDAGGNIRGIYDEMEAGNLEGTVVGMNAFGDTTNYVNTPDYPSDFQITALGSAISFDPGVVDEGEPPMIQFGNPLSPVTSVPLGPITLPTTGEVVAFVQLSQGLIKEAVEVGINDEWINAGFTDQYSVAQRADPIFGEVEGWLPLYGDPENEYPWVHWDFVNCPVDEQSRAVLPEPDRDYALSQIDTMAGYFGVRACLTLGLGCPSVTSTKATFLNENIVNISPNPSQGDIRIETNVDQIIQELNIYSLDGQLVGQYQVNSHIFQRSDLGLMPGYYSILLRFEDGVVSKKMIITE